METVMLPVGESVPALGMGTWNMGDNPARRDEWELLPWLRQRRIPIMAYSPIEQARLLGQPKLVKFARANNLTPAQVALAWLLSKEVIVIPKTSHRARLLENLKSLDYSLKSHQLDELDYLFPPPSGPKPMEML
jgi:diketogulonate reductase-like aldo/keto reductase